VKRVLCIAFLFPPIANSGTQRPLKFARYLSRYGWEPTVLTAARFDDHRVDQGLLAEMPPGLPIVRVPMLHEKIADIITMLGLGTKLAKRMAAAVGWRMRERRRTPDLYALWRPTAGRAALRLLRHQRFDAIYATGYPWTSLLIGRDVSQATGVPLIADFRDPWSGEDLFGAGSRPRHEALAQETTVIAQASAVVTVSETLTRRLAAAHPEAEPSKFVTIHNGFDPADLETPAPAPHQRFRIVFAGVWKDGYNPAPLYDVIEWLKRSAPGTLAGVEIVAAGFEPGEAARRGLSEYITETGVLPHRDAVALMRSADVLFLTNGDGARQQLGLPGKMYEYLATGRPVIALTHPEGDAGRILQRIGGGVAVATDDPGALLAVIAQVCRDKRLAAPPRDADALSAFERPNLTRRLALLLDEITTRTPLPAGSSRPSRRLPGVLRLRPR
jgi:glycosyltransferase involved in cell wall biosynthesis